MMGPTKRGPNREALAAQARLLAKKDDCMVFSTHSSIEMRSRGVGMREVLECVRHGVGEGEPAIDEYGEWGIFMVRRVAGRKIRVRVAVAVATLTIVTVYPPK